MATDTVQPQAEPQRPRRQRVGVDVSDLSAAGVQAFARSSADGPVHVERRGGRTFLVAEREAEETPDDTPSAEPSSDETAAPSDATSIPRVR